MFPSDFTGELNRQRIADLHAQADRQRLARSLPTRPAHRGTTVRRLATAVLGAAVLIALLLIETAGTRIP